MQTRTLIGDTAATTIVELREGSAYRRLIAKTAYSPARIAIGVVTGVLNNGETTALTAIEAIQGEMSPRVESQVFEEGTDLVLFPIDEEETRVILTKIREEMEAMIVSAEHNLASRREMGVLLETLMDRIAPLLEAPSDAQDG